MALHRLTERRNAPGDGRQHLPEVLFIQRDDVVKDFSPASANPSFRNAILRFGTNSRIFRLNDYDFGQGAVPLVNYTTLPQFMHGVSAGCRFMPTTPVLLWP